MQPKIIAAHPGFYKLLAFSDENDKVSFLDKVSIVAWMITRGDDGIIQIAGLSIEGIDEPVESVGILQPDGSVVEQGIGLHCDVDAWQAAVREAAKP